MKLTRTLFAAAALVFAAGATPSMAAQYQNAPAGPAADGSLSYTFGNDGGIAAGAFTDTYSFTFPTAGISTASVQASFTSALNNLTFTSVTLNGTPLTLFSTSGTHYAYTSAPVTVGSTATLVVNGVSPGIAGSYSGTLAFSPAVPEPATWALMIGGFGLVGGTMRRRAGKAVLA